ncbi:MAG: hypothetical protein M0P77_07570 [Firmicutes bacterium]|nr:hypothetical protein [Bacillota bacterium]
MKKVLALVLAFVMVFSSISFVFAETEVSDEAAALATIGMLEGDGGGVTAEYETKELNKLTGAIMILKLKGLYEEALEFEGEDNFEDAEEVKWEAGRNVLAYLKANPAVGFIGSDGKFGPSDTLSEQMLYKVLLENLGYKQVTADVADGDFAWEETLEFAEELGLTPTKGDKLVVGELAKAVVSALKTETKDGKVWIDVLVEAGRISEDDAVAAGLKDEAPELVEVAVDEVKAIGNTVIEVVFEDDVDAEAENLDNYSIDGLEVKGAILAGGKAVRLETSAMVSGKLYVITIGEEKIKFTGVGKVSGAPKIDKVESKDIEEVVVTFSKVMDFETAANPENYTIANVEVVEAEVDGDEVTLTTEGLVARKQYTLKVAEVKSIDGVKIARNASKSFFTNPDTAAPIVSKVVAKTNEKVVVKFNEEVTKESAEDLANYVIKAGSNELAIESAELVEDDDDEYTEVELVTEPQKAGTRYSITIDNISDITKAGNVMKKAVTKSFTGKRADEKAPTLFGKPEVISKNNILIAFKDDSDLDEATVLDVNNYSLVKGSEDRVVESAEKVYFKNDIYMVNLVVEELELGSYSLEASNIADEFGNVMDDKKSYFTVTRDKYASAKVKSYKVTKKDEMELVFDKPLAPASAKDLANYSFNKDLGSPKKLAYKENLYKVVITVNEFVFNKEYKLTVKDLEDVAGNVLNFNFKFNASFGSDVEPTLESAYAVNRNVVALAFDEKIGEIGAATLTLRPEGKTGASAEDVVLVAKALADGDTVVEFSNYPTVKLVPDQTYFIAAIGAGIEGAGGTALDLTTDFSKHLIYGIDEDPERVEVLYTEQVNGVSFEVTMSKDIKKIEAKDNKTITADDGTVFKVKAKDDVVTLTVNPPGKIKENKEYKVNLSDALEDLHGIPVLDEDEEDGGKDIKTILYADYVDEDAPYIVNVVAKDRETVEIEYSEAMSSPASYSIYNADENVSKSPLGFKAGFPEVDADDKEFVIIKLSTPLEGRYDYRLVVNNTAAKDLAGNKAEEEKDDEFYFDGTDLAPIGDLENVNFTEENENLETVVGSVYFKVEAGTIEYVEIDDVKYVVAEKAEEVEKDKKWVLKADADALKTVHGEAKEESDKADKDKTVVSLRAAIKKLEDAIVEFKEKVKTGSKEG